MIRGRVPIEAGGRDLELRFTTNALCRIEEKTGRAFGEIAAGLSGNVRISDLRVMFWAGANLASLDEAGEVIDGLGIKHAVELMGEAIKAAFPDAEPDTGGDAGNVQEAA